MKITKQKKKILLKIIISNYGNKTKYDRKDNNNKSILIKYVDLINSYVVFHIIVKSK